MMRCPDIRKNPTSLSSPAVAEADTDIECVVLPEVAVHLSAQHFPVIIATWFGTPNQQIVTHLGTWFERMCARAEAENTKVVFIGDTTGMEQQPGPEVRREIASGIQRVVAQYPGRLLGVTTIVGPPMMRAVIIMVLALTRDKLNWKPVKNLPQALERSFALLAEVGIARPKGLDAATYRRPPRLR